MATWLPAYMATWLHGYVVAIIFLQYKQENCYHSSKADAFTRF